MMHGLGISVLVINKHNLTKLIISFAMKQ